MKKLVIAFLLLLNGSLVSSAQGTTTIKFASFEIAGDTMMKWRSSETKATVYYIIQQFRWNRWVDWDTLKSTYGKDSASYSFGITKYTHEGINKFRIRAVNELVTMLVYSKALSFTSAKPKARAIAKQYSLKNHIIDFGRNECYELYDKNGKMIKKGYTQLVGVSDLVKGSYFLNYDNTTAEFNFK